VDADALRDLSAKRWQASATGWARRHQQMREQTAPVSEWLVEAIEPRPGQRVLDLAAGIGETGFLAAPRIAPDGVLITSDRSDGMLDGARARAAELGLDNVEFRVLDAEWIDLPAADVDAVLMRWGLMLTVDREAAAREIRRVLRPGGRFALAVWAEADANLWAASPQRVLGEHGFAPPPEPGSPGMFVLADRDELDELLAGAGFTGVEIESLDFIYRHEDFDDWWDTFLDLSAVGAEAVRGMSQQEQDGVEADLRERLAPFTAQDGSLALPARTLVAVASA
jgi:SAM-dependent methyltransferase